MDKIYYSDKMFKKDMLAIKHNFKDKNYQAVIAPYRGGLTMGTKLSHILDIPLGIINYQRLDSANKYDQMVRFAVEPVGKDSDGDTVPFVFMKGTILLVDDICDTGKSIEKIYKFLKIAHPEIEIDILCIYGNPGALEYLAKYCPEAKLQYIHDNEDRWVTFGTWEDDFNICKACVNGEVCNRDPENKTHCNVEDKSFDNFHSCEEFALIHCSKLELYG